MTRAGIASGAVTPSEAALGSGLEGDGSDAIRAALGNALGFNGSGGIQVSSDAIDTNELADDAVGRTQLSSDAVGRSQIASDTIVSYQIAAGAVTPDEAALGSGLEGDGANAIRAALGNALGFNGSGGIQVDADAIGTNELAADSVTATEVKDSEMLPVDISGDADTLDGKDATDIRDASDDRLQAHALVTHGQ